MVPGGTWGREGGKEGEEEREGEKEGRKKRVEYLDLDAASIRAIFHSPISVLAVLGMEGGAAAESLRRWEGGRG